MVENGLPSAPTEGLPESFLAPGQVLGDRYQIREMLGRGGMGEVWHAFDLKLRVEVALKALREDLFKDEKRLDLLRREVRAAREVVSPNVCRIFDLIEADGSELVSMEYVDGGTLLEVLQDRGPLDLKEAQDIASQFLAGLEAIHQAGLVHRDVKPENIMLTRAGRVVLMDFGLARQEDSGAGTVSGTPAYMAPEQAAGLQVDARADVYSAGVVLAEMVSPEGIKDLTSRQSVWEGIRHQPARVPDTPWAPVLKKAVAREPDQRHNSAHTLTRALEDVTLRVEGAEDLTPYPGLASFTEADVEYFFGREAEIEKMWRKLERPHLLALIGASGAGKSSFLRAGLIATKRPGWAHVLCTPGGAPLASLRRAVISELEGDTEALRELAVGDEDASVSALARWRQRHEQALLIVDQFEELFTQNPAHEQRRFAGLLGRLVLEADVFVLLSMREDFLGMCNILEPLRPIFHELTVLDPPMGASLRRALVQPATKCGYRFEDDELVEEMLAEVEGGRGALPLLAFAMSRLWDKRDRDNGLLTRQTYQDIGGVGGALARHAEATLEFIGVEHQPAVRELFRNLVTAEGTRAVREWDELLSVFEEPHRASAEEVLRELVDARLLTSYEVRDEDREPTRRVEIIHESLLANWPRLVRWQTQDADAAQLRDQLRQAARTWDEHECSDDLLWTGSAYREFAVWRERYPGGLTEIEEAFALAMRSLATRRRRRRRVAAAIVVVFLSVVATVLGALWRRSVLETRRAEASKLVALAQVQLEADPTEALAYAAASLKLADSFAARSMVMKALWEGPPALVLDSDYISVRFSPDGGWLATGGQDTVVEVWSDAGEGPIVLRGLDTPVPRSNRSRWISESLLATGLPGGERVRIWSFPDGRLVRTIEFGAPTWWEVDGHHVFTETFPGYPVEGVCSLGRWRSWRLPDGEPEDLGWIDWDALGASSSRFVRSGTAWIYAKGRGIFERSLPVMEGSRDRVVGTHDADDVRLVSYASTGDRLVSIDGEGELRVWSLSEPDAGPVRVIPRPEGVPAPYHLVPDPTGRWVYRDEAAEIGKGLLWDLSALPGAQPIELRRSGSWGFSAFDFHPEGDWLAASTNAGDRVSFWPLHRAYPSVVKGASFRRKGLAFSPDGRWLAVTWPPLPARAKLFPLPHTGRTEAPDLGEHSVFSNLFFDTAGTRLTGGHYGSSLSVVPLDGREPQRLEGFQRETLIESLAFSPSGRLVAAASGIGFIEHTLRVWNLDTGEVRVFDLPRTDTSTFRGYKGGLDNVQNLWFTDEDTLVTVGATKFLRWNLHDGSSEEIVDLGAVAGRFAAASADGHKVLIIEQPAGVEEEVCDAPKLYDLAAGTVEALPMFGDRLKVMALGPEGAVAVTGDADGIIRVGRIAGGEPHLLAGHEGAIECVAISPDLRWVASVGSDSTLRLWPMPDLSKPPLHTLPHDELVAKLKTLTNLRVVRDQVSATGWKVEVGPFPGWQTVPTW